MVTRAGWLRNLRLRLVSALYGSSIRFDIVVRIVRPDRQPKRGPAAQVIWRAETGG